MPTREPSGTAERLVATARAMLDEQGLDGLTLRAIARQAHVSHNTPLKHFPSFAALLAAVAATGFRDLIASVDAELASRAPAGDARERLAAAGYGYVHFAVANPGVFNLMFRPEHLDCDDPVYLAAALESFQQLERLVAAAQAEGYRPDVDVTRLASFFWTTVHGLADLWIKGGGLPGTDASFGLDDFVGLSQSVVLGHDEDATADSVQDRRRAS
jgi:AcrR family transcriptional regulator